MPSFLLLHISQSSLVCIKQHSQLIAMHFMVFKISSRIALISFSLNAFYVGSSNQPQYFHSSMSFQIPPWHTFKGSTSSHLSYLHFQFLLYPSRKQMT